MTRGFFISPQGELIQVATTHIAAVIADPARFGLTAKEILEAHQRWREQLGLEGKARIELLKRVLREGRWIRVREQLRGGWHLQLAEPTAADWARLREFARVALNGLHPSMVARAWPSDMVMVLDVSGNVIWGGRLGELVVLESR